MKKVAIHSVPRSGSSWLGEIINSHPSVNYNYQPLFSYAFKSFLDEHASQEKIQAFFSKISNNTDPFVKQLEAREKGKLPQFEKNETFTHIVYKEVRYHHIIENLLEKDNDLKVIGLIRNPNSVINSWLKAPKEFRPDLGWEIKKEWRYAPSKNLDKKEEFNGYEKWKEVYFLFNKLQKIYSDRILIVSYDDLIANTENEVCKIFSFLELELHEQTKNFISSQKEDVDTYSVNKIKTTDEQWKNELPSYIQKEIHKDLLINSIKTYI